MKLTLSGKEFTLRCDMRALANAKREAGIDISKLDDDIVSVGTFVYYLAQSGAKHADIPFKVELDDFLMSMPASRLALARARISQRSVNSLPLSVSFI